MPLVTIDTRTGRPAGDHGTAMQAITFALDGRNHDHDSYNQVEFLKAWNEGNLIDEWPEFYPWLAEQERKAA